MFPANNIGSITASRCAPLNVSTCRAKTLPSKALGGGSGIARTKLGGQLALDTCAKANCGELNMLSTIRPASHLARVIMLSPSAGTSVAAALCAIPSCAVSRSTLFRLTQRHLFEDLAWPSQRRTRPISTLTSFKSIAANAAHPRGERGLVDFAQGSARQRNIHRVSLSYPD